MAAIAVVGVALWRSAADGGGAIEPTRAVVTLDSQLRAGAPFAIQFDAVDAEDDDIMRLPLAVTLRRDGEVLNCLSSTSPHVVEGECRQLRPVDRRGPGAVDFVAPDAPPGDYLLCGTVGFIDRPDAPSTPDRFCREVELVAGAP